MIRGFRTVLVSKSSALDYSLGNINIRNSDGTIKINLNEIHTIILENTQSNLTSFLIKELIERNIAVIFCDEKHLPIGELSPLYGNYESSKKLREQINFSDELKLGVWTLITKKKIENQMKILHFYEVGSSARKLEDNLANLTVVNLLENEAKSASEYFRGLLGSKFNRRSDDIEYNASFNYIYAILLATTARYISALGYKTELGLWHRGGENKYNLASDLMEPWRPICDNYLLDKLFSSDEMVLDKSYIVNLLNQKILMNGAEQYFNNAVEIYVQSIFRALSEDNENLIVFPQFLENA